MSGESWTPPSQLLLVNWPQYSRLSPFVGLYCWREQYKSVLYANMLIRHCRWVLFSELLLRTTNKNMQNVIIICPRYRPLSALLRHVRNTMRNATKPQRTSFFFRTNLRNKRVTSILLKVTFILSSTLQSGATCPIRFNWHPLSPPFGRFQPLAPT